MRRERPRARVVNAGEIGEPDRQIIDEMQANAGSSNGPVETEPSSGHSGIPLSILDLAPIRRGDTASDSFSASVTLAQRAEQLGYRRVWYAEHHNMPTIASSATSVLIAHVAAQTQEIRLGAGGIMLPNHSPLRSPSSSARSSRCIRDASTSASGARPGSDQTTIRALRRNAASADSVPRGRARASGLPQ